MQLQNVLDQPPKVHGTGDVLFKLDNKVLRFVEGEIAERSTTLETGAGISTILFAMKHTAHTSVLPYAGEAERIRTYCREHDIPTDKLDFEIGRSEEVLPRLTLPRLDLVLIDGRHGFPTPFIDWYFTADALSVGGLLVIDDTHLWTGHVLRRFLAEEPEWRLEREFGARAAVFRKVAEGSHSKSWTEQTFMARKTATLQRINRLRRTARQARRLGELIRPEQFRKLLRKVLGGDGR
jgi:hypothetical protein